MANGKKKAVTNLAVAIVDATVTDTVDLLRAELKALVTISDTPYRTTGNLEVFGDIKTETNVIKLIQAMSMVVGKEKAYNDAADNYLKEGLQGEYPVFSVSGGTAKDWATDINLRIKVLKLSERKKFLEDLIKEAESFMTEQDKFSLFQKRIKNAFGGSNGGATPTPTEDTEVVDA